MSSDEPPYLTVGTDVSARYKGAFCEAKVKKVNRQVKCKVNFKNSLGSALVTCDSIKGNLRIGATVDAKHPDNNQYHEAVITKLHDVSQYTVVFDDGDVTTLRRTSLCLKSGKHFAESETLDQLPLTNPEHFGTPVVGIKAKRKRREEPSSGDEPITTKVKKETSPVKDKHKYQLKDVEADLGRIVCVDYGDKRKKDSWFPGLVVCPHVQDNMTINQKEDFLIKSFKDGKYYTVCKKDTKNFKRDVAHKVEGAPLKQAVEKAILFLDNGELPTHWDKEALLNIDADSQDNDTDTDTDSSDDEPTEDKDRFIAQLYNFMDERSTPINKAPAIGSRDLNLYKLFKIVQKFGGYNRVNNQSRWKNVYMKMGIPSPNANGILMLKQAYRKYLQGFEDIHKKLGYTMIGKDSTRSGRSSRNMRTPPVKVVKKEAKVSEEKKEPPPVEEVKTKGNDEVQESETRRTPRGKGKEDKDEGSSSSKKQKTEPVHKKETRNSTGAKVVEKAKDDKNNTRTRVKKEEEVKTDIKVAEAPPKRQNRKKSIVDEDSKSVPDVGRVEVENIKNGPVQIGDRVKVKYGNGDQHKIYEAKVLEIQKENSNKNFLVHYTGWNMRYDEWVQSQHIVDCVHEKSDSKPHIKKKSLSKLGESMKSMKRGRSIQGPGATASKSTTPKPKTPSSATTSKSTKASSSTPSKSANITPSNGKSPSRGSSVVSNTTDDDTPNVRSSRSRPDKKPATPKSPAVSESRRPSRKLSGVGSLPETNSSDDEIDLDHEPVLRARRRNNSETRRSVSIEPAKKLNTRSSMSKKNEKAETKKMEKEPAEDPKKAPSNVDDEVINVCKVEAPKVEEEAEKNEDVEEVQVKEKAPVDEDPMPPEEPKIVEALPEEKVPEPEVSLKTEDKIETEEEEKVPEPDATEDLPVEEPNIDKKEELAVEEPAKKVNKEVLKVEGTAIVADAFRKMAANLKKTLMVELPRQEVPVSIVEKPKENDEPEKVEEPKEAVKAADLAPIEPIVESDESADEKLVIADDGLPDTPIVEASEVKPEVEECLESASKTMEDAGVDKLEDNNIAENKVEEAKVKKSKSKDSGKKIKKKDKKAKDEAADVKKDKKSKKRLADDAENVVESDGLSFLADITINSPDKKKAKKVKDEDVDKKAKKHKLKDVKAADESDDSKGKGKKSKKKKAKMKPADPVEDEPEVQEATVEKEKDNTSNLSLLCDEDVLPASPLPVSEPYVPEKDATTTTTTKDCTSSLAALAPALAAELQHPTGHSTKPLTIEPLNEQSKPYEESIVESATSHLLLDNTPPTTPESSISTTSVVSSPSHERDVLEGASASPQSIPESSSHEQEMRIDEKFLPEVTETLEKDDMKKKRKGRRTRTISESSRCSGKTKIGAYKVDDFENNEKADTTAFPIPNQPPKSSKFNFYVPLDEYTDGAQRIQLLQEKMCELRKKYMALKAEVAQIDRRRKRARKKEREGGSSS